MPTTIKDVAKKAGVSVATVSRTLNVKDRVKDETREKILSVVKEMSFVTNSSARTLQGSKTIDFTIRILHQESKSYAKSI